MNGDGTSRGRAVLVNGEPAGETAGSTGVRWEDTPNRHAYCDGRIRQLTEERDSLTGRAAELDAENGRLRGQLAEILSRFGPHCADPDCETYEAEASYRDIAEWDQRARISDDPPAAAGSRDGTAQAAADAHTVTGILTAVKAASGDAIAIAFNTLSTMLADEGAYVPLSVRADTAPPAAAGSRDGTAQAAPELAAEMRETRQLRERIADLAARLEASATATAPSKKSQTETALAKQLRELLTGGQDGT